MTLLEILVSLAAFGIVMALGLGLVIDASRRFAGPAADRGDGLLSLEAHRCLARLTEDVRAANGVEQIPEVDGAGLLLIWPAKSGRSADASSPIEPIAYYWQDGILTRSQRADTDSRDVRQTVLSRAFGSLAVTDLDGGYLLNLDMASAGNSPPVRLVTWTAADRSVPR